MKKFFTFIAAVAMAASVNAQGTYAVAEGDAVTAGDQITSVNNVTLTYCENAGTAFAVGKKTTNWADADFGAYVCGKNSGKLVSGAAPTGCVYKFDTKVAGTLTVAVQLNYDKGFHILDADFTEVAPASYNLPATKDGTSQEFTQNDKGENIVAVKSNGTVTINAVAGGTYYVWLQEQNLASMALSLLLALLAFQTSMLLRQLTRVLHSTFSVRKWQAMLRVLLSRTAKSSSTSNFVFSCRTSCLRVAKIIRSSVSAEGLIFISRFGVLLIQEA